MAEDVALSTTDPYAHVNRVGITNESPQSSICTLGAFWVPNNHRMEDAAGSNITNDLKLIFPDLSSRVSNLWTHRVETCIL